MVGCNWNLDAMSMSEREDLMLWFHNHNLKAIRNAQSTLFEVRRIPDWLVGNWICYEDNSMPRGEVHRYRANGYVILHGGRSGQAVVTHIEYCNGNNLFSQNRDHKFTYWIPGWNVEAHGPASVIVRRRTDLTEDEWDGIHDATNEELMEEPLQAMYGEEWRERKHHFEVIQIAQNTALDAGGVLNEWPQNMNRVRHHGMWIKVVFDTP